MHYVVIAPTANTKSQTLSLSSNLRTQHPEGFLEHVGRQLQCSAVRMKPGETTAYPQTH